MARLNIEELVGGLLEAAMVAQRIAEKQHINNLANYFDQDGNAKMTTFKVGDRDLDVPLYILADHSSIGLDELDVEFSARLIVGDNKPSELKRELLGFFKRRKKDELHNIKGIEVDSGKNEDGSGMAKITIKFKSDTKPEMVSRLVDTYIQNIEQKGEQ
jgi:hypothetical protein